MPRAVVVPILAMLAVLTLASMASFTVSVLAPEAAPAMGLEPARVGTYVALMYLLAMLSGAATGTLAVRWGPIRVCQATMLCAAGAMVTLSLATPGWGLVSAVLLGCAYGPFNPASAKVLTGLADARWQPFVFSVKQCGVPLGGALAGIVVPLLAERHGWRVGALAVAAAALLVAVVVTPLRARFDAARTPARFSVRGSIVRPVVIALRGRLLRRYTLAAFGLAGCQITVGAFTVVYLTSAVGLELVAAGTVFAAVQVGGVAGRLTWGAVAERLLPSRVVLAGLATVTAVGLWAMTRVTPAWPMPALLGLGFALGSTGFGWNGVMLSQVVTLSPRGAIPETTGGMQFVMFGAALVVPAGVGAAIRATGNYHGAFLAVAGVALASAVVVLSTARIAATSESRGTDAGG
ncbi:MAG: MFS transporter [Chromatiales bacterium]|nr:MFS transporter [Chromatiales bacterium]